MTQTAIRAEAEIRQRLDEWVQALRMKDINGVMSIYADDMVSFDIVPPLFYAGSDAYHQRWQEVFDTYTGRIEYEIRDVHITTEGDVAFLHSLNHIKGTMVSGQKTDMWLRWTACLRLIKGVWKIAHLHASVPADLATGRAVTNLQPS
jgi:uncharacterized protein (TIGR02246 family)